MNKPSTDVRSVQLVSISHDPDYMTVNFHEQQDAMSCLDFHGSKEQPLVGTELVQKTLRQLFRQDGKIARTKNHIRLVTIACSMKLNAYLVTIAVCVLTENRIHDETTITTLNDQTLFRLERYR